MFVAHLPELQGVSVQNETLTLGAAVTLSELLADERMPGVLREAIAQMASPAIRNVATLGGNVCNASPAGDTLPALYCLNARLILAGRQGERRVPIERFLLGPGKTSLAADELLRAVELPSAQSAAARFDVAYYRKVGTRRANALAKLSFLGLAGLQDGAVQRREDRIRRRGADGGALDGIGGRAAGTHLRGLAGAATQMGRGIRAADYADRRSALDGRLSQDRRAKLAGRLCGGVLWRTSLNPSSSCRKRAEKPCSSRWSTKRDRCPCRPAPGCSSMRMGEPQARSAAEPSRRSPCRRRSVCSTNGNRGSSATL